MTYFFNNKKGKIRKTDYLKDTKAFYFFNYKKQ